MTDDVYDEVMDLALGSVICPTDRLRDRFVITRRADLPEVVEEAYGYRVGGAAYGTDVNATLLRARANTHRIDAHRDEALADHLEAEEREENKRVDVLADVLTDGDVVGRARARTAARRLLASDQLTITLKEDDND